MLAPNCYQQTVNMCSHSEYIEDHTSGDVVCLTCGLVLDKIFLSSQKKDFDYSCV